MLAYSGRGSILKETLDCNHLVKELAGLMTAGLSKKVSISFELHDAPLSVIADQSHLHQVFMNLLTNASDAIGKDEGRINLRTETVTLRREDVAAIHSSPPLTKGEYIRVSVSDSGAGMCPDTQSKIFDPFFTTKAAGHGLGLAAVSGIVSAHKGAIAVESELGVGTTFSVWLPLVAAAPDDESDAPCANEVPQGGHILVVDDDRVVRMVLVSTLLSAGYNGRRGGRWSGSSRGLWDVTRTLSTVSCWT